MARLKTFVLVLIMTLSTREKCLSDDDEDEGDDEAIVLFLSSFLLN